MAVLLALSTAPSASAAVTLGATDADFAAASMNVACAGDPCALFQGEHPLGRSSVTQFDGVVVRWRIRINSLIAATNATTSLRLVSPETSPMPWGAAGPPLDVPDGPQLPATISQELQLPIARGQGIAPQFQNLSGGNVFVSIRTDVGGSVRNIAPPPPPGGTGDGNASTDPRLLAIAADVETDADQDGFGDETQDGCPTDAATQGPCPPPDPGDVAPPELSWCGKRKQNLVDAGAVRACVLSSELATIEASAVLSIGKRNRAKPISLPTSTGGAAPGARAFLDLKLKRKVRRKVDSAVDDGKRVSASVIVSGTDAAGNRAEVTGELAAKG